MIAHVADEDVTNNSRNKQAHINYIIIYILHIERDREIGIERETKRERGRERNSVRDTKHFVFVPMHESSLSQTINTLFFHCYIDRLIHRTIE